MLSVRKGQPTKHGLTTFVLGDQSLGFQPGDRVIVSTAGNRVRIERTDGAVSGARGLKLFEMRRSPALRVSVSDRIPGVVARYTAIENGVELELED